MIPMEKKKCPVCDSEKGKSLYLNRENYRQCFACGLIYHADPVSSTDVDIFLKEYYQDKDGRYERLENEFNSWRNFSFNKLSAIIKKIKKKGRFLDVGCATGALFRFFGDAKEWEFFGVEPAKAAYEYASKNIGQQKNVTLFEGYLKDAHYPEKSFDIISLLEVIYYVPDPSTILKEIRRLLKDDGLFILEVPNRQCLFFFHSGLVSQLIYKRSCTLPRHFYFFSDLSIRTLILKEGFHIHETHPLPTSVPEAKWGRIVSIGFWVFAELLYKITGGYINLAPRNLYILKPAAQNL